MYAGYPNRPSNRYTIMDITEHLMMFRLIYVACFQSAAMQKYTQVCPKYM
jgi:hypothetical protein